MPSDHLKRSRRQEEGEDVAGCARMGWNGGRDGAARRVNNGQLLGMALISSLSPFLQPPAFIFPSAVCLFVLFLLLFLCRRFCCRCHFECECAVVVVVAVAVEAAPVFRVRKMCNGISSDGA